MLTIDALLGRAGPEGLQALLEATREATPFRWRADATVWTRIALPQPLWHPALLGSGVESTAIHPYDPDPAWTSQASLPHLPVPPRNILSPVVQEGGMAVPDPIMDRLDALVSAVRVWNAVHESSPAPMLLQLHAQEAQQALTDLVGPDHGGEQPATVEWATILPTETSEPVDSLQWAGDDTLWATRNHRLWRIELPPGNLASVARLPGFRLHAIDGEALLGQVDDAPIVVSAEGAIVQASTWSRSMLVYDADGLLLYDPVSQSGRRLPEDGGSQFTYSPDGRFVATSNHVGDLVSIFRLEDAQEVGRGSMFAHVVPDVMDEAGTSRRLHDEPHEFWEWRIEAPTGDALPTVALHGDGRWRMVVQCVLVEADTPRICLPGIAHAAAFSPDAEQLAIMRSDGIQLWQLQPTISPRTFIRFTDA